MIELFGFNLSNNQRNQLERYVFKRVFKLN
ncbi:hypothetical protein HC248_01991 [Polaromonas vacuolata]|uniref:Uncharacterized protein n=1 Tax=Polaromonas vacuolata TaxID=37448 RepID=A0A6H2H9X7_9BURK|nr:hypothetical protein HC248_01940 [Polaromonas vacuolata]QJC56681.1 hypothetical protein HC248_01991 [Polaromonas vacuolata]